MSRSPKRLDCRVDQPLRALPVGDVVAVDDGLASERLDLFDDLLRRREIGARAVVGTAEVVDDDARTLAGEQHGVFAAETAASTGDDRNPAVKRSHAVLLQT